MFGNKKPSFSSRRWEITGLCGGLYFGFTFAWNSLAALIPKVAVDIGLTESETGIVLGTVALTIFLTWPIVGPWVEQVGPNRALLVGSTIVSLAGGARVLANGFLPLVGTMALISLGGSMITYAMPTTVGSWFSANEAGTPIGVATVGATLGTVVSFEIMPTVVAGLQGWRPALLLASGPSLIFAVLWFWRGQLGSYRDENDPPSMRSVPTLLRRPDIMLVVVAGGMYLFATHSIYGWLSPLLINRGADIAVATRIVAILTAGQVAGIILIPYVADRWQNYELVIGLCGGFFAAGLTLLSVLPIRDGQLAAVALIAGLSIGGISPLLRTLPVEWVSSETISTVVSMVFGIGALGGFVGPVVIAETVSGGGESLLGFGILATPGIGLVVFAVLLTQFRSGRYDVSDEKTEG